MSVGVLAYFPGNVRINYVASVLGKLAGLPHVIGQYGRVHVSGVHVDDSRIKFYQASLLGAKDLTFIYNFETDFMGDGSWRSLYLGNSYAINVAAGVALVDFFGGALSYNDKGSRHMYKKSAKSNEEICPWATMSNDEPEDTASGWQAKLDERIAAVTPICQADIVAAQTLAHYPDKESYEGGARFVLSHRQWQIERHSLREQCCGAARVRESDYFDTLLKRLIELDRQEPMPPKEDV